MEQVKPYSKNGTKKEQVNVMFNRIAPKYDVANTILSFGIHHYWKKKSINILKKFTPENILDIATGTGDIAILLADLNPEKIVAVDFAENMLEIARKRIQDKQLQHLIYIQKEDGENLSFTDESFDAVTISFGIRNFENYERGINEMHRVLKKNGVLMILEFTLPKNMFLKELYFVYFKWILPIIAWFIAGDRKAYDYLPNSVQAFPQYDDLCKIILRQGFKSCEYHPLTGGIATVYIAQK